MSGKNYLWQKSWSVDLDRATVSHKDGLVFYVDLTQNGELEFTISFKGDSYKYYHLKRETLTPFQFAQHIGKLVRQAREIYNIKNMEQL